MKKYFYICIFIFLSFLQINAQWEKVTVDTTANVNKIYVANNHLFVELDTSLVFSDLLVSSNHGESWTNITPNLPNSVSRVYDLIEYDNSIYIGTDGGVFISVDNGQSWQEKNNGLDAEHRVYTIYESNNVLLAGTDQFIYRSTDKGENWTRSDEFTFMTFNSFTSNNNYMFAHASLSFESRYLYRSGDNGETWSIISSQQQFRTVHALNDNEVYMAVGTDPGKGFYVSTDNGDNFNMFTDYEDLFEKNTLSINSLGDNLFVGAIGPGLSYRGAGGTWYTAKDNLETTIVYNIQSDDTYLYCTHSSSHNYISRRPLSDFNLVTDVSDEITDLPNKFVLNQNFPNPFNPSTTINFSMPEQTNVSLKIYDVLGKEIAVLVNEEMSSGSYQLDFDASILSSGIYIYALKTKHSIISRKMVLIK